MVVLHDLNHSSRVHRDSCSRSSSILLLASRGAIKSLYPFEVEFFLHFFVIFRPSIIFVCGRRSPHNFEMLSISPQQAYSFVVDFLNNSILTLLLKMLSISFVAQVVIFILHPFHSTLSILPEVWWHVFIKYHSILSGSCSIPPCFSRSAA